MRCSIESMAVELMIKALGDKADEAINAVFDANARTLEQDAKENAPWRDRTGNARRTLTGCTELMPKGKKTLAIVGKMHYSPNLEMSYGGRYSILYPTALKNSARVFYEAAKSVGGVTL